MQKIISTLVSLTILFLCWNSSIAQSIKKDSSNVRNSFLSEKSVLSLEFSTIMQSYKFNNNLSYNHIGYNAISSQRNGNTYLPLGMLSAFYKQKNNLNKTLQLQMKWKNKQNSGIFRQILGYANFAAAGYLLYTHIKKYKDYYK